VFPRISCRSVSASAAAEGVGMGSDFIPLQQIQALGINAADIKKLTDT